MDEAFYLAGGLALLLALLSWSDQIRGTEERTRIQEEDFLKAYPGVRWRDIRGILRSSASEPDQQLAALLRFIGLFGETAGSNLSLLEWFRSLDATRSKLESVYNLRYWIVVATAVQMLIAGLMNFYFHGELYPDSYVHWEHLYSGLWIPLVVVTIALTIFANVLESRLRRLLGTIDDALRSAGDEVNDGRA